MHRQLAEVSKGDDGLDDASVARGRGKMCRLGQVYSHAVKVRARRENVHEKANFAGAMSVLVREYVRRLLLFS